MSTSPAHDPPPPESTPALNARRRRRRRARARLRLFRRRMHAHPALRPLWRTLVAAAGVLVLLAGVVFFVTPGPGIASLLLGLLILSTEFRWAHRLLRPARIWARRAERYAQRRKEEYLRRRRERRGTADRTGADGDPDPDPDPV